MVLHQSTKALLRLAAPPLRRDRDNRLDGRRGAPGPQRDPDVYDAFQKEAFTGLTGLGSLWARDGAGHHRERHLLSPQFSAHHCRGHVQVARRHTEAWQAGQAVYAYQAMLDISLAAILHVMFGRDRGV